MKTKTWSPSFAVLQILSEYSEWMSSSLISAQCSIPPERLHRTVANLSQTNTLNGARVSVIAQACHELRNSGFVESRGGNVKEHRITDKGREHFEKRRARSAKASNGEARRS